MREVNILQSQNHHLKGCQVIYGKLKMTNSSAHTVIIKGFQRSNSGFEVTDHMRDTRRLMQRFDTVLPNIYTKV